MINRYYEDELHYLHEAGKQFAKAHPEQARLLNIESVADRDPYVERLFEGFAFLTGRIRERLDDELPALTEALFSMLWPNYLKVIPSLAILEFFPKPGLLQQTIVLPAGTEVRSGPVGDEDTVCRFRTTQEVRLQPVNLLDSVLTWPPDGTTNLTMRFGLEKGIDYQKLQLNPTRIFFHAEDAIASVMHLFFTRHVARLVVSAGNLKVSLNGQRWVQPAGFRQEETLVPYTVHSFSGSRLLQEYLSFRRKFWFVDIVGLDSLKPPPKTTEFQIQIFFNRSFPEEKRFKADNMRLFCTPIANLFRADGEPIRVDHLSSEYRVVASARQPKSVEAYSIEKVEGTEEGTGKRRAYAPYFSFRHGRDGPERYFSTTTRVGPSDRYETYITPGGIKAAEGAIPVETLSIELTCTNGSVPREKLQERTITQPSPDFPNVATFENLSQPTLPLYPPTIEMTRAEQAQEQYLWKLVSHLAFNHMSVASLEALQGVLELYDWTGTDANRRRIAGLRDVKWSPKEIVHRGAIMRGAEVTVEVQDGNFADEGDLCLFGMVMSQFLSQYATINSFVHLSLVTKPSEQRYHWQTLDGVLPAI